MMGCLLEPPNSQKFNLWQKAMQRKLKGFPYLHTSRTNNQRIQWPNLSRNHRLSHFSTQAVFDKHNNKKKDILIFINNCRIHPPTFIVDDISHYLTILLEKVIGPRWNQVLKRDLLDIKDLFIVVLKSDNP